LPPGHLLGTVQLVREHLVEDVVHQGRLAGPAHAGHGGQHAERDGRVHVREVVLACADDLQLAGTVDLAALRRDLDLAASREVVTGQGPLVGEEVLEQARVDHFTAVLPRPRSDVDDPVGLGDGVLVVLDDDEGVAEVPQPREGLDQPAVVALVQADRRLVQDVQYAHESRSDLRGEPDALGLSAGQRARRPFQVEVLEPDVEEEGQARLDLLEDLVGDLRLAAREHEVVEELRAVPHGHGGHLGDGAAVDEHRQRRRVEPRTTARGARDLPHVLLVPVPCVVGLGLRVLALDVLDGTLEAGAVLALAAEPVLVLHHDLVVLAVQGGLAGAVGQLAPGRGEVEAELGGESLEQTGPVFEGRRAERPRRDGTLGEAQVRVGDHQLLVDLELAADTRAGGARAEGVVEGERARLDLVDRERVLVGARQVLGEGVEALLVVLGQVDELGQDAAVGELERRLHGVREALLDAALDDEAVDDDLDGVLVLLAQLRRIAELDELAVHPRAGIALRGQLLEEVDELALARPHDGGEDLEAGALVELEQLVDDLLRRLLGHELAADGAVGASDAGPQEPHVVVDLGDGPDGGAGVLARGLLVDRDRGRETLDEVDVRLVHLTEELSRVGGERLDIAALPLREDGVEGEGRLARTGQAGEDDHGVAREVEVDVPQVVFAGALDDQPGQVLGSGLRVAGVLLKRICYRHQTTVGEKEFEDMFEQPLPRAVLAPPAPPFTLGAMPPSRWPPRRPPTRPRRPRRRRTPPRRRPPCAGRRRLLP
jgi:hypothetical protein